jgi:hypothetical protein
MNVYLMRDDRRIKLDSRPEYCAVLAEPCPKCECSPCRVQGSGAAPSQDDRAWEARGYCMDCHELVGVIRTEVDTIFGVTEDERVLHGLARVY